MTLLEVVQPATASSRGVYERFPSIPFLWWAIGLAVTAGFGPGILLLLHLAAGQPAGLWRDAAVQANGHVQLFGWGGMFALGISLFFLPRLRGWPCPDSWKWPVPGWPPLASRVGLVAVLPFAVTFFASLLLSLAINAVALPLALEPLPPSALCSSVWPWSPSSWSWTTHSGACCGSGPDGSGRRYPSIGLRSG